MSLSPAFVWFAGWFPDLKGVGAPSGARGRTEAATGGKLSEPVQAQTPESLRPLGFSGEGSEDAQHDDRPASTLRRGVPKGPREGKAGTSQGNT